MESAMLVWSQGYEGFSRGVQEKNKLQRMLNKAGLISMQYTAFYGKGGGSYQEERKELSFYLHDI